MLLIQDLALSEVAEQTTIQPRHEDQTDSDTHAGRSFHTEYNYFILSVEHPLRLQTVAGSIPGHRHVVPKTK